MKYARFMILFYVIISNRTFGLQLGSLLLFIALFDFLFILSEFKIFILLIGFFLLIIALIADILLNPVRFVWLKISRILAIILNPMILCTIFILIFVPIGVVMKLLKRDLLDLRSNKVTLFKSNSNLVNFERQF